MSEHCIVNDFVFSVLTEHEIEQDRPTAGRTFKDTTELKDVGGEKS